MASAKRTYNVTRVTPAACKAASAAPQICIMVPEKEHHPSMYMGMQGESTNPSTQ